MTNFSSVNSKLASEALGFTNPIDFAGAANDQARVQLLIDAVSAEATAADEPRLFLDEMSPLARTSLYVMLVALKAAVS